MRWGRRVNRGRRVIKTRAGVGNTVYSLCRRSTTGSGTSRTRVRRWWWFLSLTPVCISPTSPATRRTWSRWRPSTRLETGRPATPAGLGRCSPVGSQTDGNVLLCRCFPVSVFPSFHWSFSTCLQLPARPATCPSQRWQEEVSTCPGELRSLPMDRWRATGSSTSPQLLCRVCTHTQTHTWA